MIRPALNKRLGIKLWRKLRASNACDIGGGEACVGEYLPRCDILPYPEYDAHNLWLIRDGEYELVVMTNVLEHLHNYCQALRELHRISSRYLYLSWTPWASPFGGHEFSPWHFFGCEEGRLYKLGRDLFKTDVDQVLFDLEDAGWSIIDRRPRYWPIFPWLVRMPWRLKDFLSWNVEVLCEKEQRSN